MAGGFLLILFNPIAGGGKARDAARRVETLLRGAGYETGLAPTRADAGPETDGDLPARLAAARGLIVVGGDGAVRSAADAAIESRTPLYHVPFGTVNLFAREFGMTGKPRRLLGALRDHRVRWVDAAVAGGRRFVLMASVGFDAQVVHDLARRRGASISRLSYLGPMVRQMRRWQPPELAVTVDGAPLELPGTGMIVVANCRRYMWGMNPAARADMTDGKLDVVYLPIRGKADLLRWMGRCLRGRHLADPRVVHCLGSSVRIDGEAAQSVQLDGDPSPDGAGGEAGALEVEIHPAVLPVLLPSGRRP
jgi:diacylglycerol kinase family enzyme